MYRSLIDKVDEVEKKLGSMVYQKRKEEKEEEEDEEGEGEGERRKSEEEEDVEEFDEELLYMGIEEV